MKQVRMNPQKTKTVIFTLSHFMNGGTECFALLLARALARRGVKPVILVLYPEGPLKEKFESSFEVIQLARRGYGFGGVLMALPAMVRFLKERQVDAVISGLLLLNVTSVLAARLARNPARLLLVEHMRYAPVHGLTSPVRRFFKIKLAQISHALADKVIAVSETVREDLLRYIKSAPEKIEVIPNPIIPVDLVERAQEKPVHPWLVKKEMPTCIAVGRLLGVKDYKTLLKAFALLQDKKKARLVICGEGAERAALEKEIKKLGLEERVSLAGNVENIFAALKAADLFVHASLSEAFCNALVEAMAVGVPVVCTDCGGPREILEEGRFGALTPPGNAIELALAIEKALAEKTRVFGAQEKALSYTTDRACEAYLKLL